MQKEKIKILQVCAVDETVKSLLLPLIDRLQEEGFDVTACCSYGKNSEQLRKQGYKIKNINIARSINPISNLKSILSLYKLIKREKFCLVHVHTPVAALIGRIAAKLCRVPVIIYTAHGFYFHERMPGYKYKILVNIEKFAGRYLTDFIFSQSEEDRQTAVKEGIIDASRLLTIGNGTDIKGKFNHENIDKMAIQQKKRELGFTEKDKVIIYIGRLVREKGIIELLEAFNAIKADNVKLLLVGDRFTGERDMKTFEYISKLVEGSKNILMTGRRSDINDLLYISDLFVLPSYREGMPRSIIEAMAMAKPVIATDIRGCREEVVDGETGFLFEVGNSQQLKEKIIEILADKKLALEMGCKARLRAEEFFDEDKVLDSQLKVIKALINKR